MPGSIPPQPKRPVTDDAGVDTGWSSLPPAPAAVSNEAPSGTQRLASKRRAEGTLLGVAPPRSPEAVPSPGRNPVVVHAGLSPIAHDPDPPVAAPSPDALLPIPVAPGEIVESAMPFGVPPAVVHETPPTLAQRLPEVSGNPPAPPLSQPSPARPAPESPPRVLELEPPVLKAPVAPLAASATPAATLGFSEAMTLRVRVLGARVPVGGLLAAWVATTTLLALLVLLLSARRAAPVAINEMPATPSPSASVATPAPAPSVDGAALRAKPPESRTAAEALALADLAVENKRATAARFNQDLAQNPSLLQKKGTLTELRKLVADPLTAQSTLATVANLPGALGPDVLYELWSSTPSKTEATELARALLSTEDVRKKTSDALAVALHLRSVEVCADLGLLLERARQVGDRRSLSALAKWKRKRPCASARQRDCCSNERVKDIDATISAVKARRAPFD